MSVRRSAESVGKSIVVWASMLVTSFALVLAVKHVFAKETQESTKPAAQRADKVHQFIEFQTYTTKDAYGWSRSYVYIKGNWHEYRRVSANGARVYEWNGEEWIRISIVVRKPNLYYKSEPWTSWPSHGRTTTGTTTQGRTH